eukprot:XP_002527082.2 uncharacterized protein LOC8271555 [Ricinus communis]
MASSGTCTSSLTNPEFPSIFSSHRRKARSIMPPSQVPVHKVHGFAISLGIPKLSSFKSNGFFVNSFSSDNSFDNNQVGVKNSSSDDTAKEPHVQSSTWNWKGYSIRYQYSGNSGPALVLVHGFGANSDHWRKNIPVLAKSHRVYSIDLIGYGYSEKPNPREFGDNSFYTFERWGTQLNDFCIDIVKDKAFFICNSIGVSDSNLLLICLKDEAPHLVNPLVESFVARNSTARATASTVA